MEKLKNKFERFDNFMIKILSSKIMIFIIYIIWCGFAFYAISSYIWRIPFRSLLGLFGVLLLSIFILQRAIMGIRDKVIYTWSFKGKDTKIIGHKAKIKGYLYLFISILILFLIYSILIFVMK